MDQEVKVIVRSKASLPEHWKTHENVTIIEANVLDIPPQELTTLVSDCNAVASCLGHNLSWKGIYGKPRRLVRDAMRNLYVAVAKNEPSTPVKFILMNTTGNRNRDLNEPMTFGQRIVIALLRLLLPPHPDNEQAADFLRTEIGQNNTLVEWVAVRPDSLIDLDEVTEYTLHASPNRNPIFDAGKTSRINVANFMARLITEKELWTNWRGQMPVIYNVE